MAETMLERLKADTVTAMKAREKDKVTVLRMLTSKLKDIAIEKRAELTEDEELKVLMTYAKQREEGLVEAKKAGRDDLVAKEQAELDLVRGYLPEPLSDGDLDALVEAIVAETGASSMKDMGRVMKEATARAAGRADGGRISARVKARLAG